MTVMCLSQLQKQEEESSAAFWEINGSTAELQTPSSASSDTDSLKENRPAVTLSIGNPAYNTEVSLSFLTFILHIPEKSDYSIELINDMLSLALKSSLCFCIFF